MFVERLHNAPPRYPLWFAGHLLPFEAAVTHFAFMGTTGSGKTTEIRLLMQSFMPYIGQEGSDFDQRAVIFDVKQETLSILFGAGVPPSKIHLLHPFDARGAAWRCARDLRTEAEAIQFAAVIAPESGETNRFFTDAARDCISGAIVALNHIAPLKWDLRDLVNALSNLYNLKALFASCPYTKDRLDYFSEERTGRNILISIRTVIAPFRTIAACWAKAEESVSLEEWIRDKNGSFLILPHSERMREPLSAIVRLIFQRLAELTLDLDESDERRIWYVLDEVRHISGRGRQRLDALTGLLTNGRSKGAAVILGFQDISGMRSVWGEDETDEIIALCSNQAYLRLTSGTTAKWASEQFGHRYVEAPETSSTQTTSFGPEGTTGSESQTTQTKLERRERVMPSEFIALPIASPENGIPGYYISSWFKEISPELTTFLHRTLTASESFDRLRRKSSKNDNFIPRPREDERLEPWDEQDLKRLNLGVCDGASESGGRDLKIPLE